MTDGGERSLDHRLSACSATTPGVDSVPVHSFSAVIELAGGEIALFKLDIEGAEHDVFATAQDADLRRVARFAIEYHDNLRPGTLDLLRGRLLGSHDVSVQSGAEGYGMLYATRKAATSGRALPPARTLNSEL